MSLQESIATEMNAAKCGSELKVLIDREDPDYYVGRTEADSPDVDNEVLVQKTIPLRVGDFCKVKVTETLPFDLIARPL